MLSYVIRSNVQLLKIILTIGLVLVLVILLLPKTVGAEAKNSNWSWSGNSPIVSSSAVISEMPDSYCIGRNQDISGEFMAKKVCMSSGGKIKYGTYFAGNVVQPVIGYDFDSKMYKIWGACDLSNSCLYLPGSDTLVTKQNLLNGWVKSLVVYKNFSKRLKKAIYGLTLGYDFDSSNPDFILGGDDGHDWPIGGYGASDDGMWLAVEIRQKGIGLLDIDTLKMKRISTMSFSYGIGFDPATELAVSNGGENVAIMGRNSDLNIFDVSSGCGDEATDARLIAASPIDVPCKKATIDKEGFIHSFKFASRPRFDYNGGELSFYAASYGNEYRSVSLRASGYEGQRLDYLALGDSFTSGEGETDDKYYLLGTNDEFEKCHLSTRSYPYLVAGLSNIDPLYMESVACSGATTKDVTDGGTYIGQGGRLGEKGLKLYKSDIEFAKAQAKYSFIPGRIFQEDFVKEYKPKVITIGIGGNDAGLMDKLKDCAGSGTCNWAGDAKDREQTAVEIKSVFDKLVKTYEEISIDSPDSKIYAIGYPKIIETKGKCDSVTGFLFDETEREFMNQSVIYLNEVIAAASKATGIRYIDVQDSYGDQVLCGSKSPNAANGVRTGDDTNLVNDSQWFRFIGSEGFHPNNFGHALVAGSINKSIKDLSNYEYCGVNIVVCPNDTVVAPEPSSYWVPETYHDYPTQQIATFVSDRSGSTNNKQKVLNLDSFSLEPNSLIDVEITSNPISLGQFSAGSDGSLDANIDLPADLAEGYHTVHLYGTSYSGGTIELYQVIRYETPRLKPNNANPGTSEEGISNLNMSNLDSIGSQNIDKISTDTVGVSAGYNTAEQIESVPLPEVKGASVVAKRSPKSSNGNVEDRFPLNVPVILLSIFALIVAIAWLIWAKIIKK